MFLLLAIFALHASPLRLDTLSSVAVGSPSVRAISSTELSPEELSDWSRIRPERFRAVAAGTRLSFGQRAAPTLLRIELDVPRTGRWWLVSELRTPKRIELRLGGRRLGLFGDDLPFAQRPAATTDLAIPLDPMAPRDTLFAMVSEPLGPCDVEFRLSPDRAFPAEAASKSSRDAWVVGYMSAIFLVAICLWLAVRETAFAWYTIYFACALLWLVTKRGLGFQHLWPDYPWLNPGMSLFVAHLSEGAFTFFLCALLQLRSRRRRLDIVLRSLASLQFAVAPLLLASLLSGPILGIVESLQAILPLALLGTLALCAWRDRDALARALLLAFLPLGLAMVHGTLVEFGIGPGSPATKASILTIAALFENTFATLILLTEVRSREKARLRLERDFHARVVAASDEVARDLARELHDGIGQRIYALRMHLFARRSAIPDDLASSMDAEMGDLHTDLRRVSHRLHPAALRGKGLATAVSELCDELGSLGSVRLVSATRNLPRDLPEETATHLYRIVQEALANALRHAQAKTVSVTLQGERDCIVLRIDDDGQGGAKSGIGIGLSSIRSRARSIGGHAEIGDHPGGGTRVEVRVPVGERASPSGLETTPP